MLIVGDVHGHIEKYRFLIRNHQESIQVGDMGIGFVPVPEIHNGWHKWFCGNHDNRELARKHLNCLGDWGYIENKKIFFVSGADSIDKQHRIPGVSWWADEELTHAEFGLVVAKYKEVNPEIVLTHACPDSIKDLVLAGTGLPFKSKTEYYFEQMFDAHQPKMWIFGHLHKSFDSVVKGTRFICLNELETFKL